ncbi:MAG TPA: O-antigen ligase family protein [Steroidobacteraceae bacterium]|jgi:O-antigen ligase|nr:O-antigen ligase family protein [Steroidobacteraceae bacterium]
MRFLLIALILFLTASTVFGFDPGPAPGVKIKNALLYLLLLGLLARMTLDRGFKIQMPAIPIIFSIILGYAIFSYVAVLLVMQYPRYDWLTAGLTLKNSLFDQMMFFLVFFYGLRSNEDALTVLKVLLVAWAVSHIMAVMDATGLFHVGDIEQRSDGRVQGAIGESNQYGAFVALSLPPIVAMVTSTRGIWRLFWIGASVITAATLLMTVSRGAFVATIFATLLGVWLFRRFMPARKLALWAVCGAFAAVIVGALVVALGFGDLIIHRITQGSGSDVTAASSGRTEIWGTVLGVMFRTPLTLLTGFGWDAYPTFPFRWQTHNHYLMQFFNLGLIGLIGTVLLFVVGVRTANKAATFARPDVRPVLISFGIGTIAIAAAVFFVNLYLPWIYYWSYAGIVMRLAANALEPSAYAPAPVAASKPRRVERARDPHGWTAAS